MRRARKSCFAVCLVAPLFWCLPQCPDLPPPQLHYSSVECRGVSMKPASHSRFIGVFLVCSSAAVLSTQANAQFDISGNWRALIHEDQPERIPGPDIMEYVGLPINEAARIAGMSWDPAQLAMPEFQCRPPPFRLWFQALESACMARGGFSQPNNHRMANTPGMAGTGTHDSYGSA